MVGTITMTDASGRSIDVIGQKLIRSGELAGLVEMRDSTLVDAQNQLDTLAASLASSLSDRTQAGVAAGATGFDLDTTGIRPGNVITLDVTVGGVAKRVSIVSLTSGTLPAGATPDPNDIEIGASFATGPAGALASVQAGLDAAFGPGKFTASNSGAVLRIDAAVPTTAVTGMSAKITVASPTGTPAGSELPLFVDAARGGALYTGSFDGTSQKVGFASRIGVNAALAPKDLVAYSSTTPAGDDTRPKFLIDALTKATTTFSAAGGVDRLRALRRHGHGLRQADRGRAGRERGLGPEARRGPAGRPDVDREPLRPDHRRQRRPGTGQSGADPERLFGQRPHHERREGDDGSPDADVTRTPP